jgi:hypothetical protein
MVLRHTLGRNHFALALWISALDDDNERKWYVPRRLTLDLSLRGKSYSKQ